MNRVIFRWAVGGSHNQLLQARLSAVSLHQYFPESTFVILYNGCEFESFRESIDKMDLDFVNIIDQNKFQSPFAFHPDKKTVWWKWIPIKLNIQPIEIVIDADIVFVRDPVSIRNWVKSDSNFLSAVDQPNLGPQSTNAGNFGQQLRNGDELINVGVVGMKDDIWRNLFIKKTSEILYGHTARSKHIDEQGSANIALIIGERFGAIKSTRVPMDIFCWFDGNVKSVSKIELIHFVDRRKDSLLRYYSLWDHIAHTTTYFDQHPNDFYVLHSNSMSSPVRVDEYKLLCEQRNIKKAKIHPKEDLL